MTGANAQEERGGTHVVVDGELVFEDLVALFVDGIGDVAVVLLAGVDWTPFAVPDAKIALVHPCSFLFITPL